jgi:Domain of unknown function (DUF4193)
MTDELDDVAEPEDLSEEELEDLPDEELAEKDLDDDDLVTDDIETDALGEEELDGEVPAEDAAPVAPTVEEGEEEEEEVDDEDVEASLDQILKERLVVEEEEEEDEEIPEPEDRSEGSERVLPKQPDEFVCKSCFLVKHSNQLADPEKELCRDCV